MFSVVGSVERGHTCQQHRPMHLESQGQNRSKAHCVCCGDKDMGVRHGRVILECRHCFFPRSQGVISAAGHKEHWHNNLLLHCSSTVGLDVTFVLKVLLVLLVYKVNVVAAMLYYYIVQDGSSELS